MKQNILISSFIFICFSVYTLHATTDPQLQYDTILSNSELYGIWHYFEDDFETTIEFKEKNVFNAWVKKSGQLLLQLSGIWRLKNNKIYWEYNESSLKELPPGTKDVDEILSLHSNTLLLKTQNGEIHTYKKKCK